MTIWAARSCFLEDRKGSLEVGKDADMVVLNTDWMDAKERDVARSRVLLTLVMGKMVYVSPDFFIKQ
jgi:predicted amidohydrolase YtcJ